MPLLSDKNLACNCCSDLGMKTMCSISTGKYIISPAPLAFSFTWQITASETLVTIKLLKIHGKVKSTSVQKSTLLNNHAKRDGFNYAQQSTV